MKLLHCDEAKVNGEEVCKNGLGRVDLVSKATVAVLSFQSHRYGGGGHDSGGSPVLEVSQRKKLV